MNSTDMPPSQSNLWLLYPLLQNAINKTNSPAAQNESNTEVSNNLEQLNKLVGDQNSPSFDVIQKKLHTQQIPALSSSNMLPISGQQAPQASAQGALLNLLLQAQASKNMLNTLSSINPLIRQAIDLTSNTITPKDLLIHNLKLQALSESININKTRNEIIRPKPIKVNYNNVFPQSGNYPIMSLSMPEPSRNYYTNVQEKNIHERNNRNISSSAHKTFNHSPHSGESDSKNEDDNDHGLRRSTRKKGKGLININTDNTPSLKEQAELIEDFKLRIIDVLSVENDSLDKQKIRTMLKKNLWSLNRALLTVKKNLPFYRKYFLKSSASH